MWERVLTREWIVTRPGDQSFLAKEALLKVFLQQNIYRAGSAVDLSGRDEGKYLLPAPEKARNLAFEYGPAFSRAQSLAVNDSNAGEAANAGVGDKVLQSVVRLGDGHAMQIQFILYRIAAAGQFSHCALADRRPMEPEVV